MAIEEQAASLSQEDIVKLLVASRTYEEKFSRQERQLSELKERSGTLEQRNAELEHQLEWFKRQLFGESTLKAPGESTWYGITFKLPQTKPAIPLRDGP